MHVVVDGLIYQVQTHGGISRMYTEVLPRLCEIDDSIRITLFTEGQTEPNRLPNHPRIRHRVLPRAERLLRPTRIWLRVLPAARALIRQLCLGRGRGSIWHSTYFTRPTAWRGAQVVTVYDMIFERYPEMYPHPGDDYWREQKRRCVEAANAVICISESARRDVEAFYQVDPSRLFVVPLAHSPVFRPLEDGTLGCAPLGAARPFLLYVGGRAGYKNFGRVLQAYHRWPLRDEIDLRLVGAPWTAEESAELDRYGLGDHVLNVGPVDDETLSRLYNCAVAFVYPSLCEGFGIPLLEAMACGCPIVASRIPSTVEVAGSYPFYFTPTDTESLLDALNAVSSSDRADRREFALRRAGEFSWDRTASGIADVYRRL